MNVFTTNCLALFLYQMILNAHKYMFTVKKNAFLFWQQYTLLFAPCHIYQFLSLSLPWTCKPNLSIFTWEVLNNQDLVVCLAFSIFKLCWYEYSELTMIVFKWVHNFIKVKLFWLILWHFLTGYYLILPYWFTNYKWSGRLSWFTVTNIQIQSWSFNFKHMQPKNFPWNIYVQNTIFIFFLWW